VKPLLRASHLTAAFLLVLSLTTFSHAQSPARDAEAVKAALILNFTRFTTWPESSSRPLVFVVVGNSELAASLTALTNDRKIANRSVLVRMTDRTEDVGTADVLFIDPDERRVVDLLQRAGPATLTVGEHPAFLRDGGMIRVYAEGGRMRFSIDRQNVERAGLRLSSQLLELSSGGR